MHLYVDCGSDERKYNYPGIDLNIGSFMKTKYLEFDEYHTLVQNLSVVACIILHILYKKHKNASKFF